MPPQLRSQQEEAASDQASQQDWVWGYGPGSGFARPGVTHNAGPMAEREVWDEEGGGGPDL